MTKREFTDSAISGLPLAPEDAAHRSRKYPGVVIHRWKWTESDDGRASSVARTLALELAQPMADESGRTVEVYDPGRSASTVGVAAPEGYYDRD